MSERNVPKRSLEEIVRSAVAFPIVKHQLHGYPQRELGEIVDEKINGMTQVELLQTISFALEDQCQDKDGP